VGGQIEVAKRARGRLFAESADPLEAPPDLSYLPAGRAPNRGGRKRFEVSGVSAIPALVALALFMIISCLTVVAASSGPAAVPAKERVSVAPVKLARPAVVITPGGNVPNPFITRVADKYFMFTSQETLYVPISLFVSKSLTSWGTTMLNPLPKLPSWAQTGYTWSPDVRQLGHRYVMWFNAKVRGANMQCIGVATASSIVGPYVSRAKSPLVCQLKHHGSIDPRSFVDPRGHLWLLWKSDDNADTHSTHTSLWIQQLSSDGLRLLGRPVFLATNDRPWEGRIVEAPDMVFAGGHYWLFFSGNWFNEPEYGIGVAQCNTPTGPCRDSTRGPWLASNAQGSGPGEETLFFDGSRWWILYAPHAVNYQALSSRPAALARLTFGARGPKVVKPTAVGWKAIDPYQPLLRPGCADRLVQETCAGKASPTRPSPLR